MTAANSAPVAKLDSAKASKFDSTEAIKSSHTSELVIALCGPIGSPLHSVAQQFRELLLGEFAYDKCEIITLSSFIEKLSSDIPSAKGYARTKALIDAGDTLRKNYGSDLLAEIAVREIAINRNKVKEQLKSDRHVPMRVCHIIDSIKNQEELETLKLVYRDMLYFIGVFAPLRAREKALESGGMKLPEIYTLIDRDSGEEVDHGQTVRDTFPLADFFLRVEANTDSQIKVRVERIIQLILGTKVLTPTQSETAMYVAASAAGNSACLSRQVTDTLSETLPGSSGLEEGARWEDGQNRSQGCGPPVR